MLEAWNKSANTHPSRSIQQDSLTNHVITFKVHMLYTYSLTSSGRPCKNVYPIYLLVPLGLFLSWFSRVFWYNCSAGIPGHRCCTGCTQQLKLRLCGMHLCHCIQVHEEPSRNSMEKCMKQLYGWCGCGWGWSVWNAQLQGRLLVIAKRRHHSNDRKILAHLRALPFHQPLWSTPSLQPNLTRNKQSTHRNLNIHWEEREVFHILLHGVFKVSCNWATTSHQFFSKIHLVLELKSPRPQPTVANWWKHLFLVKECCDTSEGWRQLARTRCTMSRRCRWGGICMYIDWWLEYSTPSHHSMLCSCTLQKINIK